MAVTGISGYCYCKYRQTKNNPKIFSATCDRNDKKNNKVMLPNLSQQTKASPNAKLPWKRYE